MIHLTCNALLAGLAALPFAATQAVAATRRVRFPRGFMGTILHGRRQGYEVMDDLAGPTLPFRGGGARDGYRCNYPVHQAIPQASAAG